MNKIDKATDLYLRGFNGSYIKQRTGISIQSLLKQLKSKGICYVRQDIINYQVDYISSRYSIDDIKSAYIDASKKYDDLYKAQKHKEIIMLGCCFGDLRKVFVKLLGDDVYAKLRNSCWYDKQKSVVRSKYGTDNVFCKETFDKVVDEQAVIDGRHKRNETMMERYGVLEPNQHPEILQRMQNTLQSTLVDKYGVDNIMKLPDVAQQASIRRQDTMQKRYGAGNSTQVESIRNKIFAARRNNGTLNSSFAEDALYELLVDCFGEDDVVRNVIVDKRYPYHVDFYIVSRDMFIELNGDKCHYTHWYDAASVSDRQVVESWLANAKRIEADTKKTSKYRKYIKTWTETDVMKRNIAKQNNLNYLVFWDGSVRKVKQHKVANLSDAREWLSNNCPDSCNWHRENTY